MKKSITVILLFICSLCYGQRMFGQTYVSTKTFTSWQSTVNNSISKLTAQVTSLQKDSAAKELRISALEQAMVIYRNDISALKVSDKLQSDSIRITNTKTIVFSPQFSLVKTKVLYYGAIADSVNIR